MAFSEPKGHPKLGRGGGKRTQVREFRGNGVGWDGAQRGAGQLNPREYLVSRLADVGPIPSDAPLEEPGAAIASVDPVVLSGAAVTTHFAGDI